MIEQKCRHCKHYEQVMGKRHGYCRNPQAYHYGYKRQGADKAANRCFERREEAKV